MVVVVVRVYWHKQKWCTVSFSWKCHSRPHIIDTVITCLWGSDQWWQGSVYYTIDVLIPSCSAIWPSINLVTSPLPPPLTSSCAVFTSGTSGWRHTPATVAPVPGREGGHSISFALEHDSKGKDRFWVQGTSPQSCLIRGATFLGHSWLE